MALIEAVANIETPGKDGQTPLYIASHNGHIEVVKLLVESNANTAARDNGGRTPLDIALEEGHDDVVRFLSGIQ